MFRKIYLMVLMQMIFITVSFAGEKKVLIEVFTNSHCPLCPPAHTTIDSYLQSENGNKIEFIYYHMSFPYSTDQLYQHNPDDAAAKNSFYGPHSSTPKAYFNGTLVSNSYNNWAGSLNDLVNEDSPFEIELSGNYTENNFTVNTEVTQTGDVSSNNLSINYVVVEDVEYAGNNGISLHKNVMREIPYPQGETFSINQNESKYFSEVVNFNPVWNSENLSIIVFIQDKNSKEIFQSAAIPYSGLMVTDVEFETNVPNKFSLEQNYPNPFNPTTTIEYSIPEGKENFLATQIKVFNTLGKEVTTLVNKNQSPGNYSVKFNASQLPSGIYYYKVKVGSYSIVKKMILLK